ncbi:DNA polymerase III subunit delta' [Candidatus Thiothrix sp. Deng01]|uniref:DNA-directed DNA polymerase n=1 Tax=Candidatus Thiothrix phosphatis TaxID=3112415 RepID=A0ABU6CUB0_9GAMM|nr:DNA polymerase III subunit delta' [Candidatus Thiothrix sp. Deng01]MEB4590354.1 DNA polymerase III subunit delta' [Candidatus Thiothrix sp. Deng01]
MIYPWQASVWTTLQRAIAGNHLHHALLATGEEGCGNEMFLRSLAQSLLCLHPTADGGACNQCRSCQVFAAQAHPDFISVTLLEDKQSILIEQIRELNYFLSLSRSYSPRRVAIIAPADRMNVNAANSLLKSLEEPAADTHLLLLTAQPAVLLPTIRSRCQEVRLPPPPRQTALTWLQTQELQNPPDRLLDIARGRPLEALNLDATGVLVERQQWLRHLTQLTQGNGNLTDISVYWEKYDRMRLLDWQLEWIFLLIKHYVAREKSTIPDELKALSLVVKENRVFQIHDSLMELKKFATHPLNSRSYIESMLILWGI